MALMRSQEGATSDGAEGLENTKDLISQSLKQNSCLIITLLKKHALICMFEF